MPEKLMIERLNYFLESAGQIPSQHGSTAGRFTADAIKVVL
jgi:hypothetical protein